MYHDKGEASEGWITDIDDYVDDANNYTNNTKLTNIMANKLAPYCIYCINYPAHKAPSNCDIYNAKGPCSLYKIEVDAHATCDGGFHPADEDWNKYDCIK